MNFTCSIKSLIFEIVSLSSSFQNSFLRATSKLKSTSSKGSIFKSSQYLFLYFSRSAFLKISCISFSDNHIASQILIKNLSLACFFQFKTFITEGCHVHIFSATHIIVSHFSSIMLLNVFHKKVSLIKSGSTFIDIKMILKI